MKKTHFGQIFLKTEINKKISKYNDNKDNQIKLDNTAKDEYFSNGLLISGDKDAPACGVVNCRCTISQRAKCFFEYRLVINKDYDFNGSLETFVKYRHGEKLPKDVQELLEEYILKKVK